MSDNLVTCDGHGSQPESFTCVHLAESQPSDEPIGFHWHCDEGALFANCDACEAEADDDGFLPDDFFEANFVMICRLCFVALAGVNDVALEAIEQAEAQPVAGPQ